MCFGVKICGVAKFAPPTIFYQLLGCKEFLFLSNVSNETEKKTGDIKKCKIIMIRSRKSILSGNVGACTTPATHNSFKQVLETKPKQVHLIGFVLCARLTTQVSRHTMIHIK